MNNWRLLLLAIVAVIQPIASFTDRNLIDGRQQCCDRLSSAPLQDTRSSLHGTYRLTKTIPALRQLNERDEIREDRRYELTQRDSTFTRPSTERPLVDIRGRVARQSPSEIARYSRVEYRLGHPTVSQSRERLLDAHHREDSARSIRDLKTQDLTRRVVDRTSRDAIERRHDSAYTDSSRDSFFRHDYRTERMGNERLSENLFDSQREMQREQLRSVERRITLNRDARRVLIRTKDEEPSIETSNMNNRQRVTRERLRVVRRESTIRPDISRYSEHKNERRELYRENEQRRPFSENTSSVDQVRDMRIRLNAREENRENRRLSTDAMQERREQREDRRPSRQLSENTRSVDQIRDMRNRLNAREDNRENRRLFTDTMQERREQRDDRRESRQLSENTRSVDQIRDMRIRLNAREDNRENRRLSTDTMQERREQRVDHRGSRQQNKENIDRRAYVDRMQVARRVTRESQIRNTQNERNIVARREIRQDERLTRETRDENKGNLVQRLSSERIQMNRRNILDSRETNTQNVRNLNVRPEISRNDRISRTTRDANRESLESRLFGESNQINRRNTRESTMNVENKRNIDERREESVRMSRDTREEIMGKLEQRLSRERTQGDRRDTRESRNSNFEERRESRNNEISRNTRDARKNQINRISLERTQVDRRNIGEFKEINNFIARDNDRHIDSRRESRYRMSRETRNENRLSPEHRLSLDRIQMDRRNIREFRTADTRNDKDIDNRREIRLIERSSEVRNEARLNPGKRISREISQEKRRNIREFRSVAIRTERVNESQRDIRTDTRFDSENREMPNHKLSRERIRVSRRNSRESRIASNLRERDFESRNSEKFSRETREELRENTDHRLARESRQVDRRDIRESRASRTATRNERSIETDTESRQEIRYNDRLVSQIRGDQSTQDGRVQSRSADRVDGDERRTLMMDRRARSADQRNFREIRDDVRLSRSADLERRSEVIRRVEHSRKIENREREAIDTRSRNVEMARNRDRISSVMMRKMESDSEFTVFNWQYLLYTLQAAYVCAILMQMLTPSRTEKSQKMSLRWLPVSSNYNPIKVD